MPRNESVLSVFLASPSDVSEERERVEEIISEFNINWGQQLSIRLELIKWETHAHPEGNGSPQEIINRQIGNNYDIFIGLLWHRFGTPTRNYGSGTEEEFSLAKQRSMQEGNSPIVMLYFKESPPPSLNDIDPDHLLAIRRFKNDIKSDNLFWTYTEISEFENLLRLHLSRKVQSYLSSQTQKEKASPIETDPSRKNADNSTMLDDDFGYLDFKQLFDQNFRLARQSISNISEHTGWLAGQISHHAEGLNTISSSKIENETKEAGIRRMIDLAATDMDSYCDLLNLEIPVFKLSTDKGLKALIRFVELSATENQIDEFRNELELSILILEGTKNQHYTALDQIRSFRDTIASIPSMTSSLNRAKRNVVVVVDSLMREIEVSGTLFDEATTNLRGTLQNP